MKYIQKNLIKLFSESEESMKLTHTGKLSIKRVPGHEWGSILVDKNLWKKRRDKFLLIPDLWDIPQYDPHISVFTKEEVQKLPKDFEWEGQDIKFTLLDNFRVLDPQTWEEVYECAFEPVSCFDIQKIRMDLGFTPLMYSKHEYHLTLGIKYKKDQKKKK